jgi:hypothetical protein
MTTPLSAYRSPSPPIAIDAASRLSVSPEISEAKTYFTEDLIDVERLMMHATLNSRKSVPLKAVFNGILGIEKSFHGIDNDDSYLIADRIVRIFTDKTETKSKYVSKDHFLPRPVYFDQTAKVAYVYLRTGKCFPLKTTGGMPDVKFLKVTWNNGVKPRVESAFGIPEFE